MKTSAHTALNNVWTSPRRLSICLLATAWLLAAQASAQTVGTMDDLGTLPGGTTSQALGVSTDGAVVAGLADVPGADRVFRWSITLGLLDIGAPDSPPFTPFPPLLSDNGMAIAGYAGAGTGYRWTENLGIETLQFAPSGISASGQVVVGGQYRWDTGTLEILERSATIGSGYVHANSVSLDGLVAVGSEVWGECIAAARWLGTTPDDIGGILTGCDPSQALFASSVGNVVAGVTASTTFRWTAQTGLQDLGVLGTGIRSEPTGLSSDGNVLVGWSETEPGGGRRAFRWTPQTGMQDLGTLGGDRSAATAISNDGAVVVGTARNSQGVTRAFKWSAAGGMEDLGTLAGNDPSFFSAATALSESGSVIVGVSETLGGETHAFRWTEDEAACPASVAIPYGGTFRRVDSHGIPMPEQSPTEAREVDREDGAIYVDTFSLSPHQSVTDVSLPVEGGDLSLEFRRSARVSSYRGAQFTADQVITYPSDRILGPGWHTNLGSRAIIRQETCLALPIVTVVDETGTSYRYEETGLTGPSNPLPPDTYYSINNQAERTTLYRADPDTLVLAKVFGTVYTYERLGTFTAPPGSSAPPEEYYRLASITDRNGNRIVYTYLSDDALTRESFLVGSLHEEAHPERQLTLGYSLGTAGYGGDWGDRLTTVTDPLGRVTTYEYGSSGGFGWDFLTTVVREPVLDGELDPPVLATPRTEFTYHAAELPTEEATDPQNPPLNDPNVWNEFVGVQSVTDPRGHLTSFSYVTEYAPSSITAVQAENKYAQRLRLASITTDDGTASFTFTENTHESVVTEALDTRGHLSTYEFSGQFQPASNLIETRLDITELRRTTDVGEVTYTWSGDEFSNLLGVDDVNGNTVTFSYDTPVAKQSNQPTVETATDLGTGHSIATTYGYGVYSRRDSRTDGEGLQTTHALDAAGNRFEVQGELGSITEYEYQPDGFVSAMVDPDGRRTEYTRTFDSGNLARHYTVTEVVKGYASELGLTTVRTYDVMGNLVEVVDPNTNVYSYQYDALYRQRSRTEPESGIAFTLYNLNGSAVEDHDFLGNTTRRVLDSMNRVVEERRRMANPDVDDPLDIVTTFSYGPAGELTGRVDPNGNAFGYEYDAALRLTESRLDEFGLGYIATYQYGPNSGSGAFSYTGGWQPTRVTNPRGFDTDTEFDGFYRPIRVVRRFVAGVAYGSAPQANEPTTDYFYNDVHNLILERMYAEPEAGGVRDKYTFYDSLHRQAGWAIDFDGDGNDGEGYGGDDGILDPLFSPDEDDQVTLFGLDLAGNQTTIQDPEGHLTETFYDGASRPFLIRQPAVAAGVPEITTVYDPNGNPVLVTDPSGNQTQFTYDGKNRERMRILDLDGNGLFDSQVPGGTDIVTTTGYDAMDNVTTRVDGEGHTCTVLYDRAYRPAQRIEPPVADAEQGGALVSPVYVTSYDKNSNVMSELDPRGVERRMTYDGLDRVTSTTEAFGTLVALLRTFEYDPNGNVVADTLDNGAFGLQRTEFQYDPFDRLTFEAWPDSAAQFPGETYRVLREYYRNNLLGREEDPKQQSVDFTYDVVGRKATEVLTESDGTTVEETRWFTYDKSNNLLTPSDLHGTSAYSYDALYRVLTEGRTYVDPSGPSFPDPEYEYVVVYEYDLKGNRTKTTYPGAGRVVRRTYDRRDRLETVLDDGTTGPGPSQLTTTYVYDHNDNVLSRLSPNGVTEARAYDALNRATSIAASGPNGLVYSATYDFDLVGNRLQVDEEVAGQAARTLDYTYDSQYRLDGETVGGQATTYTYDLAGNRLTRASTSGSTSYTYNERNELTQEIGSSATTTYSHDLNGNLEQKTSGGTDTLYDWDTQDRLVGAAEGGGQVFSAKYDYRTRRLLKDEGPDTLFVYSGKLTLEEIRPASGKLLVEYVHGNDMGGGVGSTLYSVRPGSFQVATRQLHPVSGGPPPVPSPSAQTRTAAVASIKRYEFFCSNHVGHTVALTRLSGAVKRTELFDAFGRSVSTTGGSKNTRRAYTKERDASLGLDNHGFRYYDPETGRYVGRDPAGHVDGLNGYLHTGNNPVNRYDPQGLKAKELVAAVGRAAGRFVHDLLFGTGESVGTNLARAYSLADPQTREYALSEIRTSAGETFRGLSQVPIESFRYGYRVGSGDVAAAQLVEDGTYRGLNLAAGPVGGRLLATRLSTGKYLAPSERRLGSVTESIEGPASKLPKTHTVQPDTRWRQQPSSSVNASDALARKLSALEKAQQRTARTRTLDDGRIRYYSPEVPAKNAGRTRGASLVTEFNPDTGQVREWMESYDRTGAVVRVHPKMTNGQVVFSQHYPPTSKELGK